jgi:hypothetical protein
MLCNYPRILVILCIQLLICDAVTITADSPRNQLLYNQAFLIPDQSVLLVTWSYFSVVLFYASFANENKINKQWETCICLRVHLQNYWRNFYHLSDFHFRSNHINANLCFSFHWVRNELGETSLKTVLRADPTNCYVNSFGSMACMWNIFPAKWVFKEIQRKTTSGSMQCD